LTAPLKTNRPGLSLQLVILSFGVDISNGGSFAWKTKDASLCDWLFNSLCALGLFGIGG